MNCLQVIYAPISLYMSHNPAIHLSPELIKINGDRSRAAEWNFTADKRCYRQSRRRMLRHRLLPLCLQLLLSCQQCRRGHRVPAPQLHLLFTIVHYYITVINKRCTRRRQMDRTTWDVWVRLCETVLKRIWKVLRPARMDKSRTNTKGKPRDNWPACVCVVSPSSLSSSSTILLHFNTDDCYTILLQRDHTTCNVSWSLVNCCINVCKIALE